MNATDRLGVAREFLVNEPEQFDGSGLRQLFEDGVDVGLNVADRFRTSNTLPQATGPARVGVPGAVVGGPPADEGQSGGRPPVFHGEVQGMTGSQDQGVTHTNGASGETLPVAVSVVPSHRSAAGSVVASHYGQQVGGATSPEVAVTEGVASFSMATPRLTDVMTSQATFCEYRLVPPNKCECTAEFHVPVLDSVSIQDPSGPFYEQLGQWWCYQHAELVMSKAVCGPIATRKE